MLELYFRKRGAVRRRRVRYSDKAGVSYCVHGAGLLGDCIHAIQHAFAASERLNRTIGIYPWGIGHKGLGWGYCSAPLIAELLGLLPNDGRVEMIAPDNPPRAKGFNWGNYVNIPTFDPFDEPAVEYVHFKETWKPGKRYRMCHQFYGTSLWRRQNFKKSEAIDLYLSLPTIDKVKLGLPRTLRESIGIMMQSDFFVGIDSGMTHLARCVGMPTFVNPNRVPMDWFHKWHKEGSPSYTVFRTLPQLHVQLRERLPWVLPGV